MYTPRRQLTFGNRTQGPSIPLRRKVTQPLRVAVRKPRDALYNHARQETQQVGLCAESWE